MENDQFQDAQGGNDERQVQLEHFITTVIDQKLEEFKVLFFRTLAESGFSSSQSSSIPSQNTQNTPATTAGSDPTMLVTYGRNPPTFKGEQHPAKTYAFVRSIELAGKARGKEGNGLVQYLIQFLEEDALNWFHINQDKLLNADWETFCQLFYQEFLPPRFYESVCDALMVLKQENTAISYVFQFRKLIGYITKDYLPQSFILNQFIRGLKPKTQLAVIANKPESLEDAYNIAVQMDRALLPGGSSHPARKDPDAVELDIMGILSRNHNNQNTNSGNRRRREKNNNYGGNNGNRPPRNYNKNNYGYRISLNRDAYFTDQKDRRLKDSSFGPSIIVLKHGDVVLEVDLPIMSKKDRVMNSKWFQKYKEDLKTWKDIPRTLKEAKMRVHSIVSIVGYDPDRKVMNVTFAGSRPDHSYEITVKWFKQNVPKEVQLYLLTDLQTLMGDKFAGYQEFEALMDSTD